MAHDDPSLHPSPAPKPLNESSLTGKWLDFYALLGLSSDTEAETLRKRIGACYAEASANCDHRDLQRRLYYQAMVERVLPQCRRILLNVTTRAAYDEQHALHQHHSPEALDYVSFMAALHGAPPPKIVPEAAAKPTPNAAQAKLEPISNPAPKVARLNASTVRASNGALNFDNLPQKVRDEINLAREVVECVASGSAFDLLPSRAVLSDSDDAPQPESHAEDAPIEAAAAPIEDVAEAAAPSNADTRPDRAPRSRPSPERLGDGSGDRIGVVSNGVIQDNIVLPGAFDAEASRARRQASRASNNGYKPRVLVDDNRPAHGTTFRPGERVLTSTARMLLTAIVAAALIIIIQRDNQAPVMATAGVEARYPLNVVYSSELRPVMEIAERDFEASPQGAGVDIVGQSLDSGAGMRAALGRDGMGVDVWIPSESLWSERYNQVAGKYKQRAITVANPIGLSPIVLVARADRAGALLAQFPNHNIPSWQALRDAVQTHVPGHFGLTDPDTSGSGATARYFMAREWCLKNKVAWNAQAAQNPQLWAWMQGFESNIPAHSRATGDMMKDMVLGNSGRYWWALAYESDALYWLSQGKTLEIFYLPRTNYADHPFCHINRSNAGNQVSSARVRFEKFLRSDAMQRTLLRSGFRPTEIALSSHPKDNPFKQASFTRHGARVSGFKLDEKVNDAVLSSLNAGWIQRFKN